MPLASGGANITDSAQIANGIIVDEDISSSAGIALSKLATDPLARANHTGTQTKSTVSDYPAAASQAEMEAGTETAAREMNPAGVKQAIDALGAPNVTALTLIPKPNFGVDPGATGIGIAVDISSNTTMYVAQIIVPTKITINKVSIRTGLVSGAGGDTIDITLYSENGQTKTVLVADGAIAAGDDDVIKTFTITQTTINPGVYYLAFNNNNASGTQFYFWPTSSIPFSATAGLGEDVASEPVLFGTVTITAGTPPATITPTAITGANNACLIVRLDN